MIKSFDEALDIIEYNAGELAENGGPRLDAIDEAIEYLRGWVLLRDSHLERSEETL